MATGKLIKAGLDARASLLLQWYDTWSSRHFVLHFLIFDRLSLVTVTIHIVPFSSRFDHLTRTISKPRLTARMKLGWNPDSTAERFACLKVLERRDEFSSPRLLHKFVLLDYSHFAETYSMIFYILDILKAHKVLVSSLQKPPSLLSLSLRPSAELTWTFSCRSS